MSNREAAAASERPLPPLPEPSKNFGACEFTSAQMHAYVLADRAASAPQVPLTDEQIGLLSASRTFSGMHPDYLRDCVRAVEAAHGIVPLAPQDSTKEGL